MHSKMIVGIVIIVLGLADAILNTWAFLLTQEVRSLAFAIVGLIIIFAGWRHYQRGKLENSVIKKKKEYSA